MRKLGDAIIADNVDLSGNNICLEDVLVLLRICSVLEYLSLEDIANCVDIEDLVYLVKVEDILSDVCLQDFLKCLEILKCFLNSPDIVVVVRQVLTTVKANILNFLPDWPLP